MDDWQAAAKNAAQKLPRGSRLAAWLNDFFANARKILWFGRMGALGCLIGAVLGEILLWIITPAIPAVPQVDVMFVLDVTGSMQAQIDGVRNGILDFAEAIGKQEGKTLDARMGLIAFRDRLNGDQTQVMSFNDGSPFTQDDKDFRSEIAQLAADGGGDKPESSLDALAVAAAQPFRPNATKVLLLITDESPHVPDKDTPSLAAAREILKEKGIHQLHLVIDSKDEQTYATLQKEAPGEVFHLDEMADARDNFDRVLPLLGETIAKATHRSLNSRQGAGAQTFLGALIGTGLWTACLAAGIGLALIISQNRYLHRADLITPPQAMAGGVGGLAAGFVAGAIGQVLYAMAANLSSLELAGTMLAWTLLGFLVGRGMAFFVPNLEAYRAGVGGAIGGLIASVGFLAMSEVAGEGLGRFLGAAILGFFLGLMIALIEAASRAFWLEVRYGQKETIKVSLGATPVSIGSNSRACTVYARDARPLAYHYKLVNNEVVCVDFATEKSAVVPAGDERQIGQVWVTVKGGSHGSNSDAPAPSSFATPKAPPPPPGKPPAPPLPAAGTPGTKPTPVSTASPKPPAPASTAPAGNTTGGMPPPPPPPVAIPRKPPEKRSDQTIRPIPPPPPPPGGKS